MFKNMKTTCNRLNKTLWTYFNANICETMTKKIGYNSNLTSFQKADLQYTWIVYANVDSVKQSSYNYL